MSWFHLALLIHIIGVLGMIGAMALVVAAAVLLRRAASIAQVRDGALIARILPKLFGPSTALILLSGIWLSALRMQQHQSIGWVVVSLIAFVAIGAFGSSNGQRSGRRLGLALKNSHDSMTPELKAAAAEPHLLAGTVLNAWVFLGIVVLMIYHPAPVAAIIALLVSFIAGLVASARVRAGRKAVPADKPKIA